VNAFSGNWREVFGRAPAWLVILAFCFISALAGFVVTVSAVFLLWFSVASTIVGSVMYFLSVEVWRRYRS
jgi:hypothetical protein